MCWCRVHAGSACLVGGCVLSDVVPGRDRAGTDVGLGGNVELLRFVCLVRVR